MSEDPLDPHGWPEEDPDRPDGGLAPQRGPRGWLARLFAAGLVAAAIPVVLHSVGTISSAGLGRVAALVFIAIFLTYGLRTALHVKGRYVAYTPRVPRAEWTARKRFWLSALVVVDVLLTLLAGALGVYFYFHPHNDTEFGVLLGLAIAMVASATATINLIEYAGLVRTSDKFRTCGPIAWLERNSKRWGRFPGVKAVTGLLTNNTAPNEVSRFVMVLIVALACAALIQAPVALPDLVHAMTPGAAQHGGGHHKHVKPAVKHGTSTTSTTPAGSASSSATPTHTTTTQPSSRRRLKPHPTLEELCGEVIHPGDGIPVEQEAEEVEQVWDRLGGAIGACPERARLMPHSTDVYYAYGDCEGLHRTLAVVSPEYPAQMVIDPLFDFARGLVESGALLGASERTDIGPKGDFQILYSSLGAYLAIRESQTDGHGGPRKEPETCEQLKPAKIKYALLRPGIVNLWLHLGALGEPTWPIVTRFASRGDPDAVHYSFLSVEEPGTGVASGQCTSAEQCQLTSRRGTWSTAELPNRPVTVSRVLKSGP